MLPIKLPLPQMQTLWKSQLDPVIANPILNGQMLSNVSLKAGTNIINHGLQRKLQGWFIVGITANTVIYDNQASNQAQDLTLVLISTAKAVINLWVF